MFFRKRKERLNKEERSQIVRIISSYAKSKGKMTVAPSIDIEDAMRLVIEFFLGKRWLEIYNENPELTVNEAICIILTMDELRPFRKKFLKNRKGD